MAATIAQPSQQTFPSSETSPSFQKHISCETYFKHCMVEIIKAKPSCKTSSKTASWSCAKPGFRARCPPKLQVEVVQTRLVRETYSKHGKLKLWKRSFCARLPMKVAQYIYIYIIYIYIYIYTYIYTYIYIHAKLSWNTFSKKCKPTLLFFFFSLPYTTLFYSVLSSFNLFIVRNTEVSLLNHLWFYLRGAHLVSMGKLAGSPTSLPTWWWKTMENQAVNKIRLCVDNVGTCANTWTMFKTILDILVWWCLICILRIVSSCNNP